MYTKILLIVICLSLVSLGCEKDPDMCIEQTSFPVVFSVFNKLDSVHEVRLTKSFSGDNGGSLVAAKIWDSIFFPKAEISATFYYDNEFGIFADTFSLIKEIRNDRDPGTFLDPTYPVYVLREDISPYSYFTIDIDIPGYNLPPWGSRLLDKPEIILPVKNDKTLDLNQDQTLFIRWVCKSSSLNEFILNFVIDSYKSGLKQVDTLTYKKLNIRSHMSMPFIQADFNYFQLLSLLNQQYRSNDVDYRSIRTVFFTCLSSTGISNLLLPQDKNPFAVVTSDYKPPDPRTTCVGFVGSRVYLSKLDFKIGSYNIEKMNKDTAFSKFKIVKW